MLDFNTLEIVEAYSSNQVNKGIMIFSVILILLVLLCRYLLQNDEFFEAGIFVLFCIVIYITLIPTLALGMPEKRYRVEVKDLTKEEEEVLLEDHVAKIYDKLIRRERYPYSIEDGKLYFSVNIDYDGCRGSRYNEYDDIEDYMKNRLKEDLHRHFGETETKIEGNEYINKSKP